MRYYVLVCQQFKVENLVHQEKYKGVLVVRMILTLGSYSNVKKSSFI